VLEFVETLLLKLLELLEVEVLLYSVLSLPQSPDYPNLSAGL
jgi:hypothetical protein